MQHITLHLTFVWQLGLFSGFYSLDLSQNPDRTCLTKLLQHQSMQIMSNQAEKQEDTSQHGNWCYFRNIVMNHRALKAIESADFVPMPRKGKKKTYFSRS